MNASLKRIYDLLPAGLQDLLVTAYGVRVKRREYGKEFDRLYSEFDRQQWYSQSELEAYQNDRLTALIRHAYDTVPYYRRVMDERRLKPNDIRSTADLGKLPILTSQTLEDDPESLVSTAARRKDRIPGHSSGTTGRAKTLYYDRHVCIVKNVIDWRQKAIVGLSVGDPVAYLLGRQVVPLRQKQPPYWRYNRTLHHLLLSAYHLSDETADLYVERLREFSPAAIESYPSMLSVLAHYAELRQVHFDLKGAFVSSEMVFPHHRKTISKAFNCPVLESYGMAERAVYATECNMQSGLHVNSDFGICELVDNYLEPVGDKLRGEQGRVVITGLHNYTMPLIRYLTSDSATCNAGGCRCGRNFPLISSIDGRQDDMLVRPDGRLLDVSILYDAFEEIQDRIIESQVYQASDFNIEVRLVAPSELSRDRQNVLAAAFHKFLGKSVSVEIRLVDELERTSSGKLRWLISDAAKEMTRDY